MRSPTTWRKPLLERLNKVVKQQQIKTKGQLSLLLDVELALTLLRWLAPDQPAHMLWALLGGYPFATHERSSWSHEQLHALATARVLLGHRRGRRLWLNLLRAYMREPADLRLYEVDHVTWQVERRQVGILPDRERAMHDALLARVPHNRVTRQVATAGRWRFRVRRRWREVELPALSLQQEKLPELRLSGVRERQPITFPFEDLREQALVMDRLTGGRHAYSERMQDLFLESLVAGTDVLREADALSLDQVVHLLGMVGAGKSTLMDVLAFWAVRQGLHVTLVLSDTAACVNKAALFMSMGLPAAPVLGRSNREQQLRKVHRSMAGRSPNPLALEEPQLRWVSTLCPLDGLTQDQDPPRPGEEPCDRLYPVTGEAPDPLQGHACPFRPVCPAHQRERDLANARIWVATPQSLIHTRAPAVLDGAQRRMLELVYLHSDLVVADEADRIQAQLDMAFAPGETLVGQDGGWLGDLNRRVVNHGNYLSRQAVVSGDAEDWLRALANAQMAATRVYGLLLREVAVRDWVGSAFFTGWSLCHRIFTEIQDPAGIDRQPEPSELESRTPLVDEFVRFAEDPLGEVARTPSLLVAAARALVSAEPMSAMQVLTQWLEENGEQGIPHDDRELVLLRLQFAIAVTVLDHQIDRLLGRWTAGSEAFELDPAEQRGFLPAPAEYGDLIPEAPMGNLLGFQYLVQPGQEGPGTLRFFRCLGVGRWLLLRFSTLYQHLDELQGPHLLLLSGTSWAPAGPLDPLKAGAAAYHVQVPVAGVLRSPERERISLDRVKFFFAPQYQEDQPIQISGRPLWRRPQKLEALVSRLAEHSGLMERVLARLPEGRKRLLVVVGSYDEARHVTQHLHRVRPDWVGKVLRLIPDDEELERFDERTDLARGQVDRFAETGSMVLVAPLLAMERGHNILNEDRVAAFGAGFFLVRPMPVPGDLAGPVHAVNAWAVAHAEDRAWFEARVGSRSVTLAEAAPRFRQQATIHWQQRLRQVYFRQRRDDEMREIFWTQLVTIWQTVGRLIRGGVSAEIYFCDAAFSPRIALGKGEDSNKTSLLQGMETVLAEVRPHPLTDRLYGPLLQALEQVEVIY